MPFKCLKNFFKNMCLFCFLSWLTTEGMHPIHLLPPKMHQRQSTPLTQKEATFQEQRFERAHMTEAYFPSTRLLS